MKSNVIGHNDLNLTAYKITSKPTTYFSRIKLIIRFNRQSPPHLTMITPLKLSKNQLLPRFTQERSFPFLFLFFSLTRLYTLSQSSLHTFLGTRYLGPLSWQRASIESWRGPLDPLRPISTINPDSSNKSPTLTRTIRQNHQPLPIYCDRQLIENKSATLKSYSYPPCVLWFLLNYHNLNT